MNKIPPTQTLPKEYKTYFWDVDWDNLQSNIKQYKSFIIARLVDKGDEQAVRWLKQCYSFDENR